MFAWLHGRADLDVAPAGPQSFLNPIPYVVPYLLRQLPDMAGDVLVTATQLVAIMLAWAIAWRAADARSEQRGWVACVAALCACTGVSVLSEIGTSLCDLVLAEPSLLALLLLLPGIGGGQGVATPARLTLAGAAAGVAVGLKLTNLFVLPATAVVVVLAPPANAGLRQRASAFLLFSGAVVMGGLLSDGFWALRLWRAYDSPIFPFMNTIFHSRSAALVDFSDKRYRWLGIYHAISIPFALAGGSTSTSENPIRDLRFAVALPIALGVLAARLVKERLRHPDAVTLLSVWLIVGSGFWLLLCPIQRYAVSLEMAAGVLVVLVVARYAAARSRVPAITMVLLALSLTTMPADFFHRPWSKPFVARVPAAVPADATYGLLTYPLAYWSTVPPRPAHAFALHSTLMETGGRLQRRLDSILHDTQDRIWLLDLDLPVDPIVRAEMRIHGLTMAPPCVRTPSPVWIDTVFCKGELAGPRADAASGLGLGQAVRFSTDGVGLIYELDGWDATGVDGTWAKARTAWLAFRPAGGMAGSGAMVLGLTLGGVGGAPPRHVTAEAGGGEPQAWTLPATGAPTERRLCIGRERLPGGVVEVRLDTDSTTPPSEPDAGAAPLPLAFKLFGMTLRQAQAGECGTQKD